MKFTPMELEGVYGIIEEPYSDSRGTLTRVWDSNSMLGKFALIQSSIVTNPMIGTLRGIHFQTPPFSENKVVECINGRVFDVVVDLREDSFTYGRHLEILLGPFETYLGLFIPAGCAHGYLTLEPDSTLLYFMDKEYSPEHASGIPWNDRTFSVNWPQIPKIISERDSNWPDFQS